MAKMLSGSEFDYREYVDSELCRISWNFVTADRVTLDLLPFYKLLFDPNLENPFPPLTEWRKERALQIKTRKEVKDYTSETQAKLEAKRLFYTHILSPWSDCQVEQVIPYCERIGGRVPLAWRELYEQRRDRELLQYQETLKRGAQNSPYPKAKIVRELNWWSWVLFPEQVAGPSKGFIKRFESDASFKETRELAETIIEGNAKFEQIGVLEGVGWRKYAMAEARIQYTEWLLENRGNDRIWESDKASLTDPQDVASQEPIPTPTCTAPTERSLQSLGLSLRAAAYYLSFQKTTVHDPRSDNANKAGQFARDLCGLESVSSGRQLYNHWKGIGRDTSSRKRHFNSALEGIREGKSHARKTANNYLQDLSIAITHLPKESKSEAESELNNWISMLGSIESKF